MTRWVWKAGLILAVLTVVFIGVGMLPGRVEGVYAGRIYQCACDSFNFMQLRDGQVVVYSSNHAPAELFGRYEVRDDGGVDFYMTPLRTGEPEKVAYHATPRLWFSRFDGFDDGSIMWLLKRPQIGKVAKIIREQEVEQVTMPTDDLMVRTTYDSSLTVLRVEKKAIKKRISKPTLSSGP